MIRCALFFVLVATLLQPAVASAQQLPENLVYGGSHEFGLNSGYAPHNGPTFGYDRNTRYSPTVMRYSYMFYRAHYGLVRYAPEVTALAVLHENAPSSSNPQAPITHFGAGFSPVSFQFVFLPTHRVQPFVAEAAGFLYFADRVLSPQGSQFMYTIGYGGGANFFATRHSAVTLGFSYQHLSNANISLHNPGTDEETFYAGFSHFFSRRSR